jgi:hypothetical protein
LEVGSFYLSDAAAFAGHNCIENDHELRRADLRVANRLSDPKFRRDNGPIANDPHRPGAALRRWLAARHREHCNYAAAGTFTANPAGHCLDSQFPRRYGPARLPSAKSEI